MGKLLSGLIAVVFVAGGLTALTTAAAEAGPYTGTIDTTCHADNLNTPRVGHPARVKFRATTAGNARPRGVVIFDYQRARSGAFVKEFTRRGYVGQDWQKYELGALPRGTYIVHVLFDTSPRNSAYKNCHTSFQQRVRSRR